MNNDINPSQSKIFAKIFDTPVDQYIKTIQKIYQHHDVFLDNEIDCPDKYRDFLTILFNSDENDSINLFINSSGGSLDSTFAIIEGLKYTQATTTAMLVGPCFSAASMIAMYCDQIVVFDSAYMMIHTAFFESQGSARNVKAHTEFTVKMIEKMLHETYDGFLTSEELEGVKSGVELWFDADQIRNRFQERLKFLNKVEGNENHECKHEHEQQSQSNTTCPSNEEGSKQLLNEYPIKRTRTGKKVSSGF
jgi:ATP-dependent protease ClpP protease subunit